MALEMRAAGKAVRFEYHDEDASTVVILSPEDDQDTLVRKLRRVIALVAPESTVPQVDTGEAQLQGVGVLRRLGEIGDYAGINIPAAPAPTYPVKPALPAYLRDEYELEEPAGPVGKGWEAGAEDLPSAPGEGA